MKLKLTQAVFTLSFMAAACGQLPEDESVEALAPKEDVGQVAQLLRRPDAVPGEYIVVFHDGAKGLERLGGVSMMAQDLALKHGGTVLKSYEHALQGALVKLPEARVSSLLADPRVKYVQENGRVQVVATQTGATWGIDRVDQAALPLNQTYNYNADGTGVHAYIIDTGVRLTHSQFTGRMGNGFDSITVGGTGADCHGHGTHVAGTVGGTTHGLAKKVTIHPVRVLDCAGSGTDAQVIDGINWVAANAIKPAVANMSLGGGASQALDDSVTALVNSGVATAVAAGNDNSNACNYSPARAGAAITVGSTTSTDARSSFSNYGTCLDIYAPGSSITSASNASDTGTTSMSGTSMASPHVAGVAALYLSANPTATAQQVRDALVNNGTLNKVSSPGTGSPNVLLYSGFIGGGTPPPTDTTPPTTSITSPAAGATVSGTATISADAADNVGVSRVEFYSGATLLGSDTTAPYSFAWNTTAVANGIFSLTTKAFDASGNSATSGAVSVTVSNTTGSCSISENLLLNPGFEAAAANWTATAGVITTGTTTNPTRTGSYYAYLNGFGSASTETAFQQLTIPSTACSASLSFWVKVTTSETTTTTAYDKLTVQILDGAGAVKATLATYSNLDKSTAYAQKTFDLAAYKGQTIRVYFKGVEDSSLKTAFFLDDTAVSITR
jgi:subtilisin family serine protease